MNKEKIKELFDLTISKNNVDLNSICNIYLIGSYLSKNFKEDSDYDFWAVTYEEPKMFEIKTDEIDITFISLKTFRKEIENH